MKSGGEMKLSRITSRGRTTIPKKVREEADLRDGDVIGFEVRKGYLVVRKVVLPRQDDYPSAVSPTMSEWSSPEDEEAWCDL